MGLNITHTMNNSQFENRENLRNAAKKILNKQSASAEATQKIIEKTIFSNNTLSNTQLSIIKASAQISLSNSMKETLRYLNSNANKKTRKTYTFGELWNIVDEDKKSYEGELVDFVIDSSIKNIFEAA